MQINFNFSWKTSLVALLMMLCCGRLSYWQWERHKEKLSLIQEMEERMREEISPINQLSKMQGADVAYKRALVSGDYDFENEVVLKNRRYKGVPGVFALTPLKIDGSEERILVSRGFIPLLKADKKTRKEFQKIKKTSFVGLIKESMQESFWGPKDSTSGDGLPWVDEWLRVDLSKIEMQLPYKLLPFYIEIIGAPDSPIATSDIVNSKSGRDEMFNIASNGVMKVPAGFDESLNYPVPVFDTVIPPGRHYGYVFEWIWIGIGIGVIALLMQLQRSKMD